MPVLPFSLLYIRMTGCGLWTLLEFSSNCTDFLFVSYISEYLQRSHVAKPKMACTITQGRINAQRGTLWKKSSILKKWKSGTFILEPANTKDGKHSLRQDEDKDFLIEVGTFSFTLEIL